MLRSLRPVVLGAALAALLAIAGSAGTAPPPGESRESRLRRELAEVFDPERIRELAGILAGEGRENEALELLAGGAEAARSRGLPGEAIDLLERGLALDARRGDLYLELVGARLEEKQFDRAVADLARARELGVEGPTLELLDAAAAWERGEPERAERIYRELAPDVDLARRQLGRLLLWTGRPREAVPHLLDPDGGPPAAPDLRLDLARALEGAGDLAAAERVFRSLTEEIPGHTTATYGLGRVLVRRGRREEGAAVLERYRELYARDQRRVREEGLSEGALAAARRALEAGDAEGAIARLEAVETSPDSLAIRAAALRALGETAAAREVLERAVALAPERDDLRARLLTLRLELREPAG